MTLSELLAGTTGGVFRFHARGHHPDVAACAPLHLKQLAIGKARDKLAFLAAITKPLDFPDRFGQNWDAVYECFTAMADRTSAGLVIVFDDLSGFARTEPDEFNAAVDVLRDAADAWAQQRKRLIALVGLDNPLLATDVPEISLTATP